MDGEWSIRAIDGVALVTVRGRNPDPVARRLRVENRLDGPVLPPRRRGVPERGWDDAGYEGVVAAGDRFALGYACPAPVERPPVAVTDEGRADESERTDDAAHSGTPAAAVRRLGRPTPPADAVPAGPVDGSVDLTAGSERGCESSADGGTLPAAGAGTGDRVPDGVELWFDAVAARIERAERLTGGSLGEATTVLEDAGDLAAVEELSAELPSDAAALRAVAERAERLAARADAADVPIDALRRVA